MKGNRILVLSQQAWGKMRISKHHYAVELARRGHQVFYLNPPAQGVLPRYQAHVRESTEVAGLHIVDHRLAFPYILKFHAAALYQFAMRQHMRMLLRRLPKLDIVWSFDLNCTYSLDAFPRPALRIFHPVDEPLTESSLRAVRGADVMFTVTREILEKYRFAGIPGKFINHGLADEFLDLLEAEPKPPGTRIQVGISGNLTRLDLDREILLRIIRENPAVRFELWGTCRTSDAHWGGGDPTSDAFADTLARQPNVVLHGAVATKELADGYKRMDAFLITYDVQRDQSRGTNYHKIMEFLATGKVIVSNNVTAYAGRPDLVQMIKERDHNRTLPDLFRSIVGSLDEHNSPDRQRTRKAFARDNMYARHVGRIAEYLEATLCATAAISDCKVSPPKLGKL